MADIIPFPVKRTREIVLDVGDKKIYLKFRLVDQMDQ